MFFGITSKSKSKNNLDRTERVPGQFKRIEMDELLRDNVRVEELNFAFAARKLCTFRERSTYIDQLVCPSSSAHLTEVYHTPQPLPILPRPKKPVVNFFEQKTTDKPAPVLITQQVLDSLRGLSLPKAASTLGVSTTALKRACRRLGIVRWSFTRGPARRGGTHGSGRRAVACQLMNAQKSSTGNDFGNESLSTQSCGFCTSLKSSVSDSLPCNDGVWWSDEPDDLHKLWVARDEPDADDWLVLAMLSWPWPV